MRSPCLHRPFARAKWALSALVFAACSSASGPPDASAPLAGDASPVREDAAEVPDTAVVSAPDATTGLACTFNDECVTAERCACAAGSCSCARGARGTVPTGSAPCVGGDDCESGLCLEGPGDVLTCSGPCARDLDCPANLPRCLSVGGLAPFCARDPTARPDAGVDADAGLADCTGACATTDLRAVFGARRGDFVRAQHGRAGADGLRIEAHFGGDPACPEANSPTPDRTLVISGLTTADRVQSDADGVRATLLDFRGDLTAAPVLRATAVQLTPRHVQAGIAVSWSVEATFADGAISGGVFAPHCDSLDE